MVDIFYDALNNGMFESFSFRLEVHQVNDENFILLAEL